MATILILLSLKTQKDLDSRSGDTVRITTVGAKGILGIKIFMFNNKKKSKRQVCLRESTGIITLHQGRGPLDLSQGPSSALAYEVAVGVKL